MSIKSIILPVVIILLMTGFRNDPVPLPQDVTTVKGIVFFDKTGDGSYDPSVDEPLRGIAVSNSREVVITNRSGIYELPLRDNSAIFVIKPRNWMVPVDDNQVPRFYYLYSREGASGNNFMGLLPTGKLPENINFPLYPAKEPDSFDVLVLGDTQPSDDKEVYYTAHDVLPELIGIDAAFGITLGDIVSDDLNLYDHMVSTLSTIGIPMWYLPGNHDNDYSGNDLTNARGAWLRTFGPTYYSFSHGPVHFIVLDNIRWIVKENKRYYRTGLGEDQLEFLRNEIKRLKKEQLLVLLSHIPYEASTEWEDEEEKKALYELIASHPNTISLTAHTHQHYHQFIGKEEGFRGIEPHHMVSIGTVCGSWWTGAPDEYGIPHAMMSDGTPNCYTFLHINGNKWKLSWRAPGKPADFQMHIDAPEMINYGKDDRIKITANIFNALPSADVKVRIGDEGEWINMKRNLQIDPVRLAIMEREKQLAKVPWKNMGRSFASAHIWIAEPQIKLDPGVYVIHVKAIDEWWQYEGKRLLHVKK